jgi:transcriptional regulator with XRE-family HTH domain
MPRQYPDPKLRSVQDQPEIALQRALGDRVRELRKKAGYSQEGFADAAGVHRTYIGTLERGEANVSLGNLQKVSKALEITLSELFRTVEKRAEVSRRTLTKRVERRQPSASG